MRRRIDSAEANGGGYGKPNFNRLLIRSTLLTLALAHFVGSARAQTTPATDPGALISMTMKGTVGVLLDEIPSGEWREAAAQDALQRLGEDQFWVERARRQVRLTYYRLVFRGSYYPPGKGPLPLPPTSGWQIASNGGAFLAAPRSAAMSLCSRTTRFTLIFSRTPPRQPHPKRSSLLSVALSQRPFSSQSIRTFSWNARATLAWTSSNSHLTASSSRAPGISTIKHVWSRRPVLLPATSPSSRPSLVRTPSPTTVAYSKPRCTS